MITNVKSTLILFSINVILAVSIFTSNSWAVPAFPGAEGGGAATVGGRGGKLIIVTNLNRSGPGSFKAACESSGARIVVFRVAGIIDMGGERITIRNPYITIAGQTAPGGGILLKACPFSIITHDVVIRYIRFRLGASVANLDSMSIAKNSHAIVVDHCSLSWATDENIGIFALPGSPHNITLSWNIIAEGFSPHSCGVLTGSSDNPKGMTDIDFHHNLFISNAQRNPQITIASSRIVNNLLHNWGQRAIGISGGANVDIIGNIFKGGRDIGPHIFEIKLMPYGGTPSSGLIGDPSVYIINNIGPNQHDPAGGNWNTMMSTTYHSRTWTATGNQPDKLKSERSIPLPRQSFPITEHDVMTIEELILPHIGAGKRIDETGNWIVNRDAVDERLIQEYRDGTGQIPDNEGAVGGYPLISHGRLPLDSDNDGIPDAWEILNGFDKDDPSDSLKDANGNGYLNIEEYYNGTLETIKIHRPTNLKIMQVD